MKFVPAKLTRSVGLKVLVAKKNSPHIFFGLGLAGVVGGTILACRATLNLEEKLDEVKKDLDNTREIRDLSKETYGDTENIDREYYQHLGLVYGKATGKILRLYTPAIVVGGLGVAALTGSHIQLSKRNAALSVTLAAVSKAYEDYRGRIREELGEERELDIYRGFEEKSIKNEEGKKELVKVSSVHPGGSPYARIFDESNPNWKKNAELNRFFIECQQRYLNDRLKAYGFVFLNEAYEQLGFDRDTGPGAIVGWVWNGEGDNFIDLSIYELHNEDFLDGQEPRVWLDFNVDGVIFNKA